MPAQIRMKECEIENTQINVHHEFSEVLVVKRRFIPATL